MKQLELFDGTLFSDVIAEAKAQAEANFREAVSGIDASRMVREAMILETLRSPSGSTLVESIADTLDKIEGWENAS
jgi:CHASE3 domain sensor protein